MTDIWTKGRPRGQHRESHQGGEPVELPAGPAPVGPLGGHPAAGDVQEALQMLTLAQRTAEEHVAGARRQAEQIHAEARAAAERILHEVQAQADKVRGEADQTLADARAQAAKAAADAEAHTAGARQDGDKIVFDARAQAAEIARTAQAGADELGRQAQRRYDEMVGTLVAKRESLQQQIEALQGFDRDYRTRLLTFMQAQVRALWVEEPQVDGDLDAAGAPARADAPGRPAPGRPAPARPPAGPAPAGPAPAGLVPTPRQPAKTDSPAPTANQPRH